MMAAALVICFLVGLAMGIALVISGIIPREDEVVILQRHPGKARGHDADCNCFLCNAIADTRQEPPHKNRLPVLDAIEHCLKCQAMGAQKVIDFLLDSNMTIALGAVERVNHFLWKREEARYVLTVEKHDNGNEYCKLTPKEKV